jgi:hypothetical protein
MNYDSIAGTAAVFVIATLLGIPRELIATELTFANHPPGAIDQSYGDRVTSTTMMGHGYGELGEGFTPNITTTYDPNGGLPRIWPSGYGDLATTLFEGDQTAKLQVKFTADAGYRVWLHRWDLALFGFFHPNGESINGVAVYGANGMLLFSRTNLFVPAAGHIRFNAFSRPLIDTMLTLEIDARNITTGFRNEDIGIDNILISQVPEAASATLMIIGAGAIVVVAIREKRRR